MVWRHQSIVLLILFDLLFLPRLLFLFGIPASLFLVIHLLMRKAVGAARVLIFSVIALICLASVINGFFIKGDFYLIDDVKRAFQLLTALLYGFVIFNYSEVVLERSAVLMRVFFIWVFLNAAVFLVAPDFYYNFISNIYPEALESIEDNISAYRFSYFFSDPNSAAYFLCFVICLYCVIEKNKWYFAISLIFGSATIIGTQSRGGYVAALCIVTYLFIRWRLPMAKKSILLVASSWGIFLLSFHFYPDMFSIAYELYEYRAEAEEALGLGLGGGRIQKYQYFFSHVNLLPFGLGYSLLVDGVEFRPHSDLIRINLSYGMLMLPALFLIAFPRSKDCLVLFVVFMIAFLVNTVIDDYKLLPLYLFALNSIHALSYGSRSRLP
jgi:hypothetical protein